MLVSRLVPLAIMGGVAAHSGGAINERLAGMTGAGEKVIAKQRIVALLDAASLHVAAGEDLDFKGGGFRAWAKKAVRIKNNPNGDASLDPWGTAMKAQIENRGLTITSAGPDKKFGTKDDVKGSSDIYNQ